MKKEDYYDQGCMDRYDNFSRSLEQREIKSLALIERFKPSSVGRFIDIGCGDGLFLQEVRNKFSSQFSYFGGEYSEYQRARAKERGDFEITYLDLEHGVDYGDNFFDFVYSGEVIEHLYNPDLMIMELSRIIKPGGFCIITTPNMNSWISRILFPLGMQPVNYECSTVSSAYGYSWLKNIKRQDWPVGHVRLFNRHSLQDIMKANGFEVLEIQGAVFEFIPAPLRFIDKLFSYFPSFSSGLIFLARKI